MESPPEDEGKDRTLTDQKCAKEETKLVDMRGKSGEVPVFL